MKNNSTYNSSSSSYRQTALDHVQRAIKMARSERTSHETKFNNWFEGRDPSRDKI